MTTPATHSSTATPHNPAGQPAVVLGCGPVGQTAALCLASWGVPVKAIRKGDRGGVNRVGCGGRADGSVGRWGGAALCHGGAVGGHIVDRRPEQGALAISLPG